MQLKFMEDYMQGKNKRDHWRFTIIFGLLAIALCFLYISRSEKGILFLVLGCILFIIALAFINRIDKDSKNGEVK